MNLELLRYSSTKDSTLGLLFDISNYRKFLCYTLEDEHRTRKIKGETRIPGGKYEIKLRKTGGFHSRYSKKFDFHDGMLWLQNVPNFKYIYIHIGNDDDDTSGCILVGNTSYQNLDQNGFIGDSTKAYERIYKHIVNKMHREKCYITIVDYDQRAV